MPSLTDIKMQVFLLGFRAYTRVIHTSKKIFNSIVRLSLSIIPDALLWTAHQLPKETIPSREEVTVVMAKGFSQERENTQDITNAIKLFLNIYWDNMACESEGGIQLFKLKEIFGGMNNNVIWIIYLFRNNELKLTGGLSEITPHLRYMFIDLKKEIVYNYGTYDIPGSIGFEPIEIMFDQISFNPNFEW